MSTRDARAALVLRITAAVNILSGCTFAVFAERTVVRMYAPTLPVSSALIGCHVLLWVTIGVIGIGYGLASRNPREQSAMIWIGAIGKWAAVVTWGYMWMRGYATNWVLPPIAFDATWGALLFHYLLSSMRAERVRA